MSSQSMELHQKSVRLLSQLVTFCQSGQIIQLQSPVLQQWPWENDILLEHRLMAERMRCSLSMSEHEPAFVAMVLVSKWDSDFNCIAHLSISRNLWMPLIRSTKSMCSSIMTEILCGSTWVAQFLTRMRMQGQP